MSAKIIQKSLLKTPDRSRRNSAVGDEEGAGLAGGSGGQSRDSNMGNSGNWGNGGDNGDGSLRGVGVGGSGGGGGGGGGAGIQGTLEEVESGSDLQSLLNLAGAIKSVSLSFRVSSVGVSVIVEKPVRREFLCLTVTDVQGKLNATSLTRSIELVSAAYL